MQSGVVIAVVDASAATTGILLSRTTASPPAILSNGSTPGGTYMGGIDAHPGQVTDFPVTVENKGSMPITLLGAQLLPLPGFPAPELVHLGVLAEHNNLLTGAHGWPVWRGDSAASGHYALRPLRGYVVLPWKVRQSRHLGPMPDMIEYGIIGRTKNTEYFAAGLAITYRIGDSTYTQALYAGGSDCVLAANISRNLQNALHHRYCGSSVGDRAFKALLRLAHG